MGKLLPIILVVVGLASGVGAGIFLRPAADEAEMHECTEAMDAHGADDMAHGDDSGHDEVEMDSHGNPVDDHGAEATGHGAPEEHAEADCAAPAHEPEASGGGGHGEEVSGVQYAKLSKQFVVPVVADGRVSSLVVMSLSIEVDASLLDTIYMMEPKLRDAFLSVMFLHANSGGFDGEFTRGEPMGDLRGSLRETAQEIMGHSVTDVLITEIIRQDV